MHEVGVEPVLGHHQRARHGVDCADETGVCVALCFLPLRDAADGEPTLIEALFAKTADVDVDVPRQGTGEIFNVHAGAPVNVRRIFLREEGDLAERHGETSGATGRWLGAHRAS